MPSAYRPFSFCLIEPSGKNLACSAFTLDSFLVAKPDVPPSVALNLIVQLQAYAAKFGMLASWYTNVKKDDRAKKNVYYSAREQLDRLVDSLKYSVRHYG